jgi:hypothetical protein
MARRRSDRTRREFHDIVIRAFAFASLATGGRGLTIDPIVRYRPETTSEKLASAELSELGHELLFRSLKVRSTKVINGIPGTGYPFLREEEVHPASRRVIRTLIEKLGLTEQFREVRPLDTTSIIGNSVLIGGPVNNWQTRMILGSGGDSPLFSLHKSGKNFRPKVRFDLSRLPSMVREGREERLWPLLLEDRRIDNPGELLLITSIPDPYQVDARITILTTNLSPGAYVPELILTNPNWLERLLKRTRDKEAWQVLIPVTKSSNDIPVELGEAEVFSIDIDFDNLRKTLCGKPSFSFPNDERFMGFMGLIPAYLDRHPEERIVEADSSPSKTSKSWSAALPRSGEEARIAVSPPEKTMPSKETTEKKATRAGGTGKEGSATDTVKRLEPPPVPEWIQSLAPLGWEKENADFPYTFHTADFNEKPLNGESPDDVLREYGIEVRVLGDRDPLIGSYSIWLRGPFSSVHKYTAHLMKTWPAVS